MLNYILIHKEKHYASRNLKLECESPTPAESCPVLHRVGTSTVQTFIRTFKNIPSEIVLKIYIFYLFI